ncbi:MAG: ABC transporter ATP-binding protein [Cardiobacteriaceae bacterium]|nr:ABC transporter ATP-binding protein [Cardiobacteriaceae bacterium]
MKNKEILLSIRNISQEYKSNKNNFQALKEVSLDIYRGEFVCVLGASGCGKSSLLNIIAGFNRATEGEIYFQGKKITGITEGISVVFQQPNLYEWLNVEDNVNFALRMQNLDKEEVKKRTEEILKEVGLAGLQNKYIYDLSGGMKQRLGIARALINNPELILMDEPFSALDAITKTQMQNFTHNLWLEKKNTVFFITHDIDEALRLATKIVVMSPSPGRIIKSENIDLSDNFSYEDNNPQFNYSSEYIRLKNEILQAIVN